MICVIFSRRVCCARFAQLIRNNRLQSEVILLDVGSHDEVYHPRLPPPLSPPILHRHDLRHDRQRHLFRSAAAQIQPDGVVDAVQLLIAHTHRS